MKIERQQMETVEKYPPKFYELIQDGSLRSAKVVVPLIMNYVQPKSVVDLGCGVGSWLSIFKECGVERILGMDGDYVNQEMLKIPRENFKPQDLQQPVEITDVFDLAISLEVAEHLPQGNAADFVKMLTRLAPVVCFSAAVPYQTGDYHINEQWPEYWTKLFQQEGYVVIDCLRFKIWNNTDVEWWYSQNMLIFVKASDLSNYPLLKQELDNCGPKPLSMVHPRMHLHLHNLNQALLDHHLDTKSISFKKALSILPSALHRSIRKKL